MSIVTDMAEILKPSLIYNVWNTVQPKQYFPSVGDMVQKFRPTTILDACSSALPNQYLSSVGDMVQKLRPAAILDACSSALPNQYLSSVTDMARKLHPSVIYEDWSGVLTNLFFPSVTKMADKLVTSWTDYLLRHGLIHQFFPSDYHQLKTELEFVKLQRYKVDVTLDADTAHPRLEVSEDGKSVTDTGTIRNVPRTEKRFDSHTFLLAKEGYTSGKRYWEVDVGKRRNWDVGIAREPVARKGTLTLSPKNGFWVIGLADGREYWARTEPWTRLAVSGKPQKIGIFLDTTAKRLSFYNVSKKTAVYTFSLGGDSSQEGKFFPFFSTGSISAKPDTEALKIVQGFDDDNE
ncbi:E3 ubiquitin-protein ligase TRIM39-like isoform X2 [Dromaius novaehollandiae]|uniref:E3 ubiquitin-protein ligase TRIM39-like isoform X2 n=1 Tax=Dromaius novaehollandiae TaxID=8790 RepID=UPI00311FA36A